MESDILSGRKGVSNSGAIMAMRHWLSLSPTGSLQNSTQDSCTPTIKVLFVLNQTHNLKFVNSDL